MQREYNIRWGRSDYSRIAHTVRKVNKKINSITDSELRAAQPDLLDYQSVKSTIKTRSDLNKFLNRYERYLREGAEEVRYSDKDAPYTVWEKHEFDIMQRTENAKRTKRAKKLGEKEVTIAGKPQGVKRAEMGSITENDVKQTHYNYKKLSKKEMEKIFAAFDKKMHSAYSDERKRLLLNNYVKGLIKEGYPEELQQLMNHIPIDKFTEIIDTDETATINFIYDALEFESRTEILFELWGQYSNNKINNNIDYKALIDSINNSES